ncbi:MAG: alginate O-acetyltransferase AlgX-related protein [Phycisphaerae bacterium]
MMSKRFIAGLTVAALIGTIALAGDKASAPKTPASEFRARCLQLSQEADKNKQMAVKGEDGWLFFAGELRHLGVGEFWGEDAAKVSKASKPNWADPVGAITAFNDELKKLNIRLIMVPVPAKAAVYPDKLSDRIEIDPESKKVTRIDDHHQEFYDLLGKKGVEVMDVTEDFIKARKDDEKLGPVYCKTDTHFSGRAAEVIAAMVRKEIGDAEWLKTCKTSDYPTEKRKVTISGDLWRSLPEGKRPERETLPLTFVGKEPIEPSDASPVILLGDSHGLVFHLGGDLHAKGAGLADHLAKEFGFPVDRIAVRGSGATPSRIQLYRKGARDANYFDNKKLVIWCFSAREFTEASGWREVPVKR